MLRVVYSYSAEELLGALARDVAAARAGAGLLEPTHLVVPDRHVAAWVKLGLARRAGLCANVQIHYLKRFFGDLVAGAAPDVRLVDAETLFGLVLGVLLDDEILAAAELAPARAYVEAVTDPFARDLRRVQLAERLAHLFEEYELSRPDLLDAWRRAKPGAAAAASDWQRHVWRAALGPRGALARRAPGGARWLTLRDLLGDEPALRLETLPLPPRLHLFGFAYLATTFIRLLERLGRTTEVRLYTPHPCREEAAALLPARLEARPVEAADPFDLLAPGEAEGLRLWGRPGREHLRLLAALGGAQLAAGSPEAPAAPTTLLQRVQQDLRERRTPDGAPASVPDGSLTVLRCPSVRREAEIVAGEIWRLIAADPTLRFHDIAVVVAAPADERYRPHLEAAFRECHGIPYSLADLPLAGESRVVQAVELLLRLPFGTYTRPELLRLVTHPAVSRAFPDADPAQWLAWCAALGIVHGADHGDHAGTYIAHDILNWDQGLRRLALGAFMAGERSGEARAFELGAERYLVEEPADPRAAAQLGLLVRSLIADSRRLRAARLPLAAWAQQLAELVATYVAAAGPDEEADRLACLRGLEGLGRLDLGGRAVSYRVAYELAHAAIAGLPGTRGRSFADGVVVSTLRPMRAVPFRVVFVAGLQEGSFPASEARDSLDLRGRVRRAGDVSPRERDKYLFLETLLAARDRLYLSYVDRDLVTGAELQPSAVLVELQHLLGNGYLDADGVRALEVGHPLRRHDEPYLAAPAARAEAQALELARRLRAHVGGELPAGREARLGLFAAEARDRVAQRLGFLGPPAAPAGPEAAPTPLRLSLATLRRFLECPLQGHAGFILGLEEDEEDVLAVEDEPFATAFPAEVGFLRRVLGEALVRGLDVRAHHDEQSRLQELRGAAPTGVLGEVERERQWETLATWLGQLAPAGASAPAARRVGFGSGDEPAVLSTVLPPVALDLELADELWPRRLRVEITGKTEPLADDGATTLLFATRGVPREELEHARMLRDLLRGFLDHVVLAASGLRAGVAHRVRVCLRAAGATATRDYRFRPLPADEARGWLGRIVTSLLTREHGYLLPCEAAFLSRRGRAGAAPRPVAECLALVQQPRHGRVSYSSSYGPVTQLARFSPPPEREAQAMIDERLGCFLDLLEEPA